MGLSHGTFGRGVLLYGVASRTRGWISLSRVSLKLVGLIRRRAGEVLPILSGSSFSSPGGREKMKWEGGSEG